MRNRLSWELLEHADQLDRDLHDDLPIAERDDWSATKALTKRIVTAIITSREEISSNDFTVLEKLLVEIPDTVSDLLDESYARAALEECDTRVARTLRLSHLSAANRPSAQTQRYVSEATRAFVAGLEMASVAMSRAALEQALKERLSLQNSGEFHDLKDLIKQAAKWKLLSKTGQEGARNLAKRSNEVIHERPLKDADAAFEILTGIRSLLEEIYSSEGSY